MKKILLSASALFMGYGAFGQVIFSEDFQSNAMPSGWIIADEDGLTPAANVSWCTDAWVVRDDFVDATNKVAASTSWYSPAGVSNDWMIMQSMTQDANYPDGYEVRVSTSGTTADITTFSDLIYDVSADASAWNLHVATLGNYVGQTINVAFRNITTDGFVLLLDDISAEVVPAFDAGLSALTNLPYAQAGNVNIEGTFTNYGSNTINAIDIIWSDGTNSYTDNLTGLNITSGASYNFSHATPLTVASGVNYNIDVMTSLPNDGDPANDMMSITIGGMSGLTTKNVVGEEATGTWCGWCPRGAVALEDMENVGTFIGIAIHNADPMVVTDYDNGIGAFISGYPSAVTDRVIVNDPTNFQANHNSRINEIAPADVSVTNVIVSGNTITFDVEAAFAVTTNGDFRLNAVIVENDVTGTGNGWSQVNYYSGGGTPLVGAGHNWQTAADPVPAVDMYYDHVARDILGGFNGLAGSIPASVVAGNTYTQSFSYTVQNDEDINEIHLVGMLHNNANNGEILNAGERQAIVGISDESYNFEANIFPNPTNDVAIISLELEEASSVNIEITSITGAIVKASDKGVLSGNHQFAFNGSDLEAGIYFVRITVGNQILTKRVVLSK